MTAKWRNLLAMLLVFAVSPFSMCASSVCSITCSFQRSAAPGSRLIGQQSSEAVRGSGQHDARMHCRGPADSEGAHSVTLRNRKDLCHRDKCLSPEVVVGPTFAQRRCTGPTPAVDIDPLAGIPLATPSLVARYLSSHSRKRLPDGFAVSGILRI